MTTEKIFSLAAAIVAVIALGLAGLAFSNSQTIYQTMALPGDVSNFSGVHVAVPTAVGTATPGLMVDCAGVNTCFEVRDASTPVAYVNDGGALGLTGDLVVGDTLDVNGDIDLDGDGFDVNITAGGSIDTDGATNLSASAGDITIDAEAGSLVLIGSEAAADSITLDANDTVTSGLNIDVGSVSGMTIDGGLLDVGGGTCGVADGDNDVCIAAVLEVDGELEADGAIDADSTSDFADTATFSKGSGDALVVSAGGTLNVDGVLDAVVGTEHLGVMSIVTAAVTFESSGALFTVGDGEIWIVHAVLLNVTTNFDCTGDNCTLTIGDGNDADGFLVLADAELQTADTEGTGFAAGWQGLVPATQGVYVDSAAGSNYFIYAPSGSAETVDITIGGTSPAAGAATAYIIYTRIQ